MLYIFNISFIPYYLPLKLILSFDLSQEKGLISLFLLLNLFLILSFSLSLISLFLLLNFFQMLSFKLILVSLVSLFLYFLLPFTFYLLCEYAYKGVILINQLNLKSLAFKVYNQLLQGLSSNKSKISYYKALSLQKLWNLY